MVYQDIDLVTPARAGRAALAALVEAGYEPNERFNALHGDRRLILHDPARGRHLDVFVGRFEMCHAIPLAERLELEPRAVPLAELLLTKFQIREFNRKDEFDVYGILLGHEVAGHDDGAVNADRVAAVLAADWGLWRTCTGSIATARGDLAASGLARADQRRIDERLQRLVAAIDAAPKSLRWRARARVGDRARWYEEPDEIDHGPGLDP